MAEITHKRSVRHLCKLFNCTSPFTSLTQVPQTLAHYSMVPAPTLDSVVDQRPRPQRHHSPSLIPPSTPTLSWHYLTYSEGSRSGLTTGPACYQTRLYNNVSHQVQDNVPWKEKYRVSVTIVVELDGIPYSAMPSAPSPIFVRTWQRPTPNGCE